MTTEQRLLIEAKRLLQCANFYSLKLTQRQSAWLARYAKWRKEFKEER